MSQVLKRQRYRVDDWADFLLEYRRENDGTISIWSEEQPDNSHGGDVRDHHLYSDGHVCVASGREPRDLDRAVAIASRLHEGLHPLVPDRHAWEQRRAGERLVPRPLHPSRRRASERRKPCSQSSSVASRKSTTVRCIVDARPGRDATLFPGGPSGPPGNCPAIRSLQYRRITAMFYPVILIDGHWCVVDNPEECPSTETASELPAEEPVDPVAPPCDETLEVVFQDDTDTS